MWRPVPANSLPPFPVMIPAANDPGILEEWALERTATGVAEEKRMQLSGMLKQNPPS